MSQPTEHSIIRAAAAASNRLLRASSLAVSPAAMSRMSSKGFLYRVAPGIYIGSEHLRHPLIEAAAWTLRYPLAVTCLLTAAVQQDLTDAFPRGTWFYIPKGTSVIRSRGTTLQVVQTAARFIDPTDDKDNGIQKMEIHGVDLRITNPDRTVLDMWRYPDRIAAEYALEGLRRRIRADDFRLPRFARLARRLRVWKRVEPVLQGVMLR